MLYTIHSHENGGTNSITFTAIYSVSVTSSLILHYIYIWCSVLYTNVAIGAIFCILYSLEYMYTYHAAFYFPVFTILYYVSFYLVRIVCMLCAVILVCFCFCFYVVFIILILFLPCLAVPLLCSIKYLLHVIFVLLIQKNPL